MTAQFTIRVGSQLPPLALSVTGTDIADFARASGDNNPIHLDPEAARAAGQADMIVHGMLTMALLGRLVTAWVPQDRLRSLRTTFVSPVPVGDRVSCTGTVTSVDVVEGEHQVHIRLTARRGDGTTAARGRAVVAVEHRRTEGACDDRV